MRQGLAVARGCRSQRAFPGDPVAAVRTRSRPWSPTRCPRHVTASLTGSETPPTIPAPTLRQRHDRPGMGDRAGRTADTGVDGRPAAHPATGASLGRVRADRVLGKALATGADPPHLTASFDLSETTAVTYATLARQLLHDPTDQVPNLSGAEETSLATQDCRQGATQSYGGSALGGPGEADLSCGATPLRWRSARPGVSATMRRDSVLALVSHDSQQRYSHEDLIPIGRLRPAEGHPANERLIRASDHRWSAQP